MRQPAPVPGVRVDRLRTDMRRRVKSSLTDSGLTVEFEALFDGVNPLETPVDSQLVRAAESLTGVDSSGVVFGTEGPFLAQLGAEVLILGPGSIDQAHQADEYLALENIQPAVEILRKLIELFCVTADE